MSETCKLNTFNIIDNFFTYGFPKFVTFRHIMHLMGETVLSTNVPQIPKIADAVLFRA